LNFNSPLTVAAGMHRDNVRLDLNTPAPPGGLTIALTSGDRNRVLSPTSLTMPAGSASGFFTVTGVGVTAQAVPITATATTGNVAWASQTLQVTVTQPVLLLQSVLTTRTVGAAPDDIGAMFCVSQFDCSEQLNSAQTVTFSLDPNSTDVTL